MRKKALKATINVVADILTGEVDGEPFCFVKWSRQNREKCADFLLRRYEERGTEASLKKIKKQLLEAE